MSAAGSREFDLVLLGATGFVGRLTALQLARHAPPGMRIALSGRSTERLSALRDGLDPRAADWPLVTLDVSDEPAVAALAARARVLVTTVGPYLRYGLPVVRACAETGTDYADLTGEALFVRLSIDECHARAEQTGARIVHSCGFDSVPSDLGVGLTAARAAADGQGALTRAVLHVRSIRGGVSGGTIDSLRQSVLEVSERPELRGLISDPWCLADHQDVAAASSRRGGPTGRPRLRRPISLDLRTDRWQAPFVMGPFNRQIVHRSRALAGEPDGHRFSYREVVDTGRGLSGALAAAAVAAGSSALVTGMWFGATRRLLDRALPEPGRGPSEQTRRQGRFLVEVVGETEGGARYVTQFGAELDPGYDATAVMLAESGLALAEDDLPPQGGVLTPMTALGESLAQRLRRRGFAVDTQAAPR